MYFCKGMDEKNMTKNEAYPVWIWGVIRNGFIIRILRKFVRGHSRF